MSIRDLSSLNVVSLAFSFPLSVAVVTAEDCGFVSDKLWGEKY